MKIPIRKSSAGLSVTYYDGDYTNNLIGVSFSVKIIDDDIVFYIDMTRNIKVRNKEENCYFDAKELIENHSNLKSLAIYEDHIIEELTKIYKRYPDANWEIDLDFGTEARFIYAITMNFSESALLIKVQEEK